MNSFEEMLRIEELEWKMNPELIMNMEEFVWKQSIKNKKLILEFEPDDRYGSKYICYNKDEPDGWCSNDGPSW